MRWTEEGEEGAEEVQAAGHPVTAVQLDLQAPAGSQKRPVVEGLGKYARAGLLGVAAEVKAVMPRRKRCKRGRADVGRPADYAAARWRGRSLTCVTAADVPPAPAPWSLLLSKNKIWAIW